MLHFNLIRGTASLKTFSLGFLVIVKKWKIPKSEFSQKKSNNRSLEALIIVFILDRGQKLSYLFFTGISVRSWFPKGRNQNLILIILDLCAISKDQK